MTLDHVTITVADLAAAAAFYDAVLAPLGLVRHDELVDEEEDGAAPEALSWGPGDRPGELWVVAGDTVTGGVHLSFRAPGTAAVEAFAAAATTHGGSVKDPPRRWAVYRHGRFSAMVRDPAGNLIEAVADEA